MPPVPAAIALGSNLPSPAGDSRATVLAAITAVVAFPRTRLISVSSLHETAPVGPAGQGNYINAAAKVETSLSARELLACMLSVEQRFGRDRAREQRWGPRTLDLDLILFGDALIDEPGLRIPHPRMHERAFVLGPLCEVWPDAVHPVLKLTVRALRDALPH